MTFNLQPTVQIYGLPLDSSARLTPNGKITASLVQDFASMYVSDGSHDEQLVFDGEVYRTTVVLKYGIADGLEAGINLPYVTNSGGILDSFIFGWHNAFGMAQGGRDTVPNGTVNYSYRHSGVEKIGLNSSSSGVGDISVAAGMKLYDLLDGDSRQRVAIRGSVKFPTGDSSSLRGSGSTDLALSLCGMLSDVNQWGDLGVFGSVGGLAMTDSRVLSGQHRKLVGFGTAGVGWGPSSWITFKIQLNATTPFYAHSSLVELAQPSLVLVTGGSLFFSGNYQLDIGVSEDVALDTAPDVAFHFALTKEL